jgi:transposase-like protein
METETKVLKSRPVRYPDSYKLKICEEYIKTGVTKAYLMEKYNIAGADNINYWLRKFGLENHSSTHAGHVQAEKILSMQKKQEESVEDLKKQIKVLERELEDTRIKVRAANLTIDIAEKQLNIKIRKKFNTK